MRNGLPDTRPHRRRLPWLGCVWLCAMAVGGMGAGAQEAQPNFAPQMVAPPAAPVVLALPGLEVKQEKLAPDTQFQTLEFDWCSPVAQPEAVLIIAAPKARTEIFLDEAWVAYARKQRWALVTVGVEEAKGLAGPVVANAISSFDQRLSSWIAARLKAAAASAAEGKEVVPELEEPVRMIVHATGDSVFWAESLVMLHPARYAAWMMTGASRFADIPKVKDFKCPPGAILCPSLKQHNFHLDHFEDLRANNADNPVAYVGWDGKIADAAIDSFARLFFDDAVKGLEDYHRWLNIHTLLPAPDPKTKPNRQVLGWYPSSEVVGAVKALRPAQWPKVDPSLSRRSFKSRDFSQCELGWIRNDPKPVGILVVANTTLPANIRHMPEWVDYAKKRHLALLLMGLKEGRVVSYESSEKWLETRLFKEIDALAGPGLAGLPLVTYAQGISAKWLQALLIHQPGRFKAWVTTGLSQFPAVTTDLKVPPGMLLALSEPECQAQLLHFEDLRAADPYNPVTLTVLAKIRPPPPVIDNYIRGFIDASLTAKRETFLWRNLHTLAPPTRSMLIPPDPKQFAWFPTPAFYGMWKALRMDTVPTPLPVITKHSFKTKLPEIPELKIFVRMPGALMKGQSPNGILCFCTWQQEDTSIINRLKSSDDYLMKFADRRSLAILSWNTASLLPKGVTEATITSEMEAELQNKFTLFGAEWQAAVKKVCRELKLEDKDLLVYGISRGARFVHQLSMRYPQQFLAVHTHIGSTYNEILPQEAKHTLWLATTGEVDGGYRDTLNFYKRATKLDIPILFKAGESLGHASRRDIEELSTAFFGWALDLRDQCEKEHKKGTSKIHHTPANLFAEAMKSPGWWGDYINNQALQSHTAEVNAVPEEQLIALPTEPIAQAWGMSLEQAQSKPADPKKFAAADNLQK